MAKVTNGTSTIFPKVIISGPPCMDCGVKLEGPLALRLVVEDGDLGLEVGIVVEGTAHAITRVKAEELLKDLP